MSHIIHLSDERYQIVASLAAEEKKTPEELINLLIDQKQREAEYALVDAAFDNDPDWHKGIQQAAAEAETHQGTIYDSTEAFLRHLGANEDQLAAIRRIEQGDDSADS